MVVFLWLCGGVFCDGVFVVVFLWWCLCGGAVVFFWCFFPKAAAKGSFKKSAIKQCYQRLPKVLLK